MATSGGVGGEGFYTVLRVYARAGERIQMGSSAMQLAGGSDDIRVYGPGVSFASSPSVPADFPADPVFNTHTFSCNAGDPGTGRIGSRAAEIAGPLPNAGGYTPCEYAVPADGIYSILMYPHDPTNSGSQMGSVTAPNVTDTQESGIAIWDVTVRDAGDVVHEGRVFSNVMALFSTNSPSTTASDVSAFLYTKTGYEYAVGFQAHYGVNWKMAADDRGVVSTATKDPLYQSAHHVGFPPPPGLPAAAPLMTNPDVWLDARHPIFFNRPTSGDMLAITGPGGLGEVRGFSATTLGPGTNPFGLAFTGAGGQSGETNHGSGGTIAFSSLRAMEGLRYRLLLDLNQDGTFGGGTDVSTSGDLSSGGNSFAWNGRDANGNVSACGSYQYRVQSALSEVHLTQDDVEASGGTTLERLSLPTDPALPGPYTLAYNDNGLTDSVPQNQPGGDSSVPGFHAWGDPATDHAGNNDWIDQWARLAEVQGTGTLQVRCPDVGIVKSSTAPLVAGERATYRLVVTNHGPGTAVNVRASDELPSGVSFVSTSDGCSQASGTVTCTVASLPEGESRTFTVTVDVASSADGCEDVRNTATVTSEPGPDPEPINNESTICNFEKRADLSLSKEESSATVTPGGQVMYTMVVRNRGPSDDSNVRVTDPVPAGLTLQSADPAQGSCSIAGGDLSCNLGSLKAGGSTQILVTAQLSGTECVTNTARVGGDAFDPNLDNNVDDARVCPEGGPTNFDLVVAKSVNKKNPLVGETVRYRVVVRNNGPDAAPSVTVKDTLNAPVKVVSVKASQGSCTKRIPMTCELGTIPAGGRVTITIRAKHREPASGDCSGRGGQRNAASATGDGTDTNPANNLDVVKVCPKVKLELTKKVSTPTVTAGQAFSYTIRVRNPSKVAVRKVRTCDRLPAGLVFVSATPKAKLSKGQHCWTAKTIGAGKSKTYKVTVRALSGASGRLLNTASASSPDTRTNRVRRPVEIDPIDTDPPTPTG